MVTRHATKMWIKNDNLDISIKDISGDVTVHWHEFYEIELILSGGGTYIIDDIPYSIRRGSLYLMSPISFHKIHFEGEVRLINMMFPVNFANKDFLFKIFGANPHFCTQISEEDILFFTTLAEDVVRCGETEDLKEYLEAVLNCVLAKISLISGGGGKTCFISPVGRSILYIQDNLSEELSLESVSTVANYSPNYFSEVFKRETGLNFNAYVTELRLSFAQKLLRYSSLTVTEICYECGFHDYSNFMRCFKSHIGISPKKYRDNH